MSEIALVWKITSIPNAILGRYLPSYGASFEKNSSLTVTLLTIRSFVLEISLGETGPVQLRSTLSVETGCNFLGLAEIFIRSLYSYLTFSIAGIWSLLKVFEVRKVWKMSFLSRPAPLRFGSKLVFEVGAVFRACYDIIIYDFSEASNSKNSLGFCLV